MQLVETCSAENDVQLILTVLPQTAVENDANALTPVLADLEKKGLLPEAMLADTAYGSDENVQAAAELGVELVTPTPGNGSTAIVIGMKPEDCANCPFREACPVEKTKKGKYKVEYTPKQRRQEERRRE